MGYLDDKKEKELERVIQESVPGKQVTLAHVIAAPDKDIYSFIDIKNAGAIGILTLTPTETAIIATDIATKAAEVKIGFLDRETGTVVITGDVQSVETALKEVTNILTSKLGFASEKVTKT
ncbi:MAG: BMC domain-containing protein [Clostridiales Family XIII bacterium]|jgi:ethanolamine utilization protein EutS|nr:BMC domain-containing protein [Clostridiales Family XIII bacterium]